MHLNTETYTFKNFNLIKIQLPKNLLTKQHLQNVENPLNQKIQNQIINQIKPKVKPKIQHTLEKTEKTEILNLKQNYSDIFFSYKKKLTNSKVNKAEYSTLIAKFKKIKHLINFCKNTYKTFKAIYFTSALYLFNNQAFILITKADTKMENDMIALMAEFKATTEKGKFQEAIIKEHCKTIFLEDAIEKISTYQLNNTSYAL